MRILPLIAVCLAVSMISRAEEKIKPSPIVVKPVADLQVYVGKSIAMFLDDEHVSLTGAEQDDEPPGILRFLSFKTGNEKQLLVITLRRDNDSLFSRNRAWSDKDIRNGIIASIKLKEVKRN